MVTTSAAIVSVPVIPESLIFETINGHPLYYKGYQDVVAGVSSNQKT